MSQEHALNLMVTPKARKAEESIREAGGVLGTIHLALHGRHPEALSFVEETYDSVWELAEKVEKGNLSRSTAESLDLLARNIKIISLLYEDDGRIGYATDLIHEMVTDVRDAVVAHASEAPV